MEQARARSIIQVQLWIGTGEGAIHNPRLIMDVGSIYNGREIMVCDPSIMAQGLWNGQGRDP